MDEHERWSFHLEYLKVALTLATAVIAAAAAIYVDDAKIPGGPARYWLAAGVASFVLMLVASAASLGLLSSHVALYQPPPAGAPPPASRLVWWTITCANASFVFLVLGALGLAWFFAQRTLEANGDGFERAVTLARRALPLDASKNETAALKSVALVGDAYELSFSIAPGGGAATVITDAAGRQVRLAKRP
ncbi:hypothetical protein [Methylocella sp.]|uniref:hypothetical protein n=1 Tax=Methylocella sp. TaxID=1978226 RepID=UPI0035AECF69